MLGACRRLAARCKDFVSGCTYVDGTEAIDIERLISPLRYDVLVRKAFFALLDREWRAYDGDFHRFMEIADQCPYRLWFERVYCPRFKPALLRDPAARKKAYRKRVLASISLYSSYQQHGFLPDHKIVLRSGRAILPADSGKPVSAKVFPGDGCHRLALLLNDGATMLQPHQYLVKMAARYAPLDNTARLLHALPPTSSEYAAFISAAFTDSRHGCLNDLLEDVKAHAPWRLGELTQTISTDCSLSRVQTN